MHMVQSWKFAALGRPVVICCLCLFIYAIIEIGFMASGRNIRLNAQAQSNTATILLDICHEILRYCSATSRPPESMDDLLLFLIGDEGGMLSSGDASKRVRDGWGRPIQLEWKYDGRRRNILLTSCGADGVCGTSDDLSHWCSVTPL